FIYYAPGATHAPHHVPNEWSDKYKGKFSMGWDALRRQTFEEQKRLGIIPEDAELTARPDEIPAYDEMPEDIKPVLERQMEVYAGFLEHTDHHVGRLVDALERMEILDNTIIYYIMGDNGASAEGTLNGTLNELLIFNDIMGVETAESLKANLDKFGGPDSFGHYSYGWAHAMCTPYQWTKQIASHWGGTRNGCVVHWPQGIESKGEIRTQFHHAIDVVPTILEAAGLPAPQFVEGVAQTPYHGESMMYSFDDAAADDRHTTQYFEIFVNRGIYHEGWTACTIHTIPWETEPRTSIEDDIWELYGPDDWTQAHDLAAENPEKLAELQTLFLLEADKYLVTPLDDRKVERFNAELAGRPELITGDSQIFTGGMKRLSENSVIVIKNKSHAVSAELTIPEGAPADGTVICQGGKFGGWSIFAKEGVLKYCYNMMALESTTIAADRPLPAGDHQVRVEFDYDGGGLGKGGVVSLYIDGEQVGEGRVERTAQGTFSLDETTDVGEETGTTVSDECSVPNRFNGKIKFVQIDVGMGGDKDHYLSPDERFRIAAARQ
ncbi:MAG: sulfatase-like hydrolase/transferase, partial [Caldilineaceae bacterium]|nr:sulfatase-like hydrolase/transferase [Caldilineaceae bacterium]